MCSNRELIEQLRGGLIVSCQASPSPSLEDPAILAAIAEAVVAGGAVGIRADGPENIRAIRKLVKVPVIGIWKRHLPDSEIHITPRLDDAPRLAPSAAFPVCHPCDVPGTTSWSDYCPNQETVRWGHPAYP